MSKTLLIPLHRLGDHWTHESGMFMTTSMVVKLADYFADAFDIVKSNHIWIRLTDKPDPDSISIRLISHWDHTGNPWRNILYLWLEGEGPYPVLPAIIPSICGRFRELTKLHPGPYLFNPKGEASLDLYLSLDYSSRKIVL